MAKSKKAKEEEIEQFDIQSFASEMCNKLIEKNLLTLSEIYCLCKHGVTIGLVYLNNILLNIEEDGLKSTSKVYTQKIMDTLYFSTKSEFYFRTNHFYQNGLGSEIPMELIEGFLKLEQAIEHIENLLLYGEFEQSKTLSMYELSYLLCALADEKLIRSNPTVLANALGDLTDYSYESIERTIKTIQSTKGGREEDKKTRLKKKIENILSSY